MDDIGRGILGDQEATGEQIRQGWERAVSVAIDKHREAGVPVATWDWETGQVILLPANDPARCGSRLD